MAGGGFSGDFSSQEHRVQEQLRQAFEKRDAHMQTVEKRLKQHENALKWLADEHLGKHMSQRDYFESATKYNSIVLGVGYAGFFGLWSMVRDQAFQYPRFHALAALLIGVSLALFVLWEVYCMFLNTVATTHPRSRTSESKRWLQCVYFCRDRIERVWIPVFLFTLLSGIGGLSCLGWILVSDLLRAF